MLYDIKEFEKKTPSDISYDTIELKSGKEVKVYTIKSVQI